MGCTSAKQINTNKNINNNNGNRSKKDKSNNELAAQILWVVDVIEEIKRDFLLEPDLISFRKPEISIEEFLIRSYKTDRYPKEDLRDIYERVQSTFGEVKNILNSVQIALTKNKTSTDQSKETIEIMTVFKDFYDHFFEMTNRILTMPSIAFDNYQNYEISKCITVADSQSIIIS